MLAINFGELFIALLVLLFSLTVHEAAHAWTADRLGDPTARLQGRMSLNPIVHVDPIGTILFPLLNLIARVPVVGWAKPVPVNLLNLRNYRRDYLVVAAAGPASNLALALLASVALRLVPAVPATVGTLSVADPVLGIVLEALKINVLLAIFNMIPIPPLDGGNVLAGLLPEQWARGFDRLRPYGFLVLLALMASGALSVLVSPPYFVLVSWLL